MASAPLTATLAVLLPTHVGECVQAIPALERLMRHGYQLSLRLDVSMRPLFAAYDRLQSTATAERLVVLSRYAPAQFISGDMCQVAMSRWRQHASLMHFFWSLTDQYCCPELAPNAPTLRVNARPPLVRGGYVVIVPFASCLMAGHSRCWPHYAALVLALREVGQRVLVCPAAHELQAARACGAELLESLDLQQYAQVLSAARCVISNDTGPAHMSAALGVPTLVLCGCADTAWWSPKNSNVQILKCPQWPSVTDVLHRLKHLILSCSK